MSGQALLDALRHNAWATVTLIEFLAGHDPAILRASAPGTYGEITALLGHIVGAEQWYVRLLTRERVGRQVRREDPPRELDELLELARELGRKAIELVRSEPDPLTPVRVAGGGTSTVGVILAQLVHHSNEHRGQVATILGANGVAPPALSAWAYGRAAGVSDVPD